MTGPQERLYRFFHRQDDLVFFQVIVKETDLDIGVSKNKLTPDLEKKTHEKVIKTRHELEEYISRDAGFIKAMTPYSPVLPAPEIALQMSIESAKAGVGPMASVAGAFAEWIGRYIALLSREVIVENGGDIYLRTAKDRSIGIFAADSPFSNKIAIRIKPYQTPLGICTSSGTIGHSISEGSADAVVILSPSVMLADAVATASGNMVKDISDLQQAVDFAMSIPGITGAMAIKKDKLSAAGNIELIPL